MDWEKIFANTATDKGLTSKKIQTALAAQYQKNEQPNLKKWVEDLHRHFSKDIQMAKKHIRCYLKPIRMAIIKKSINNKCWKKWRKGNPPILLVGI